jgi:erythromycin esterase-like protein
VTSRWTCWQPYALNSSAYLSQSTSARNDCAANLKRMFETLEARRASYSARSSAAEYERMLRYARVIVQDEDVAAFRGNPDEFMAENAEWLLDVAHPGEKFVLWAHNFHVAATPGTVMGAYLRREHPGRKMVIFGFLFSHGGFNAINGTLRANTVGPWTDGNPFEDDFRAAGHPLMLLDLRDIRSTAAAHRFSGWSTIWLIGALFAPGNSYRQQLQLALNFDVILWIEEVTPSRLRP